jgi:hypothetical protein
MNEAERLFSEAYINEMKTLFHYVVNIPIKVKKSHLPKYRLVFGTNSEDGLLLGNGVWEWCLGMVSNLE